MNVSSLADSQGELTSDSKAEAEMLNDVFSSVFTKELETDMPVLDNLCDAKLVDISVTVNSIKSIFSSVFTKELETDMPVLDNLCDAKLVDISVTVNSIKSKLQKL